jgi:hypothetical protein
VLAKFVDGADVRMIQSRSGPGFSLKSFPSTGIVEVVFGQEFQGNVPAQASVLGPVHNTHPSSAEFF